MRGVLKPKSCQASRVDLAMDCNRERIELERLSLSPPLSCQRKAAGCVRLSAVIASRAHRPQSGTREIAIATSETMTTRKNLSVMLLQFLIMLAMALPLSEDALTDEPPAELAQKMLNFGLRGYPGSLFCCGHRFRYSSQRYLWRRCRRLLLDSQANVPEIQLPVQAVQDVVYQKDVGFYRAIWPRLR